MSLFPLFFDIAEQSLLRSMRMPPRYFAYQPRLRYIEHWEDCDGQKTKWAANKDGFQVNVNVQDYSPDELSVKAVDNTIVVEGKHEERQDEHGFISRQFTRRYTIPNGYDIKSCISHLSSDGILTLKAPPLAKTIEDNNIRAINIEQTGAKFPPIGNKENQDMKDNNTSEKSE